MANKLGIVPIKGSCPKPLAPKGPSRLAIVLVKGSHGTFGTQLGAILVNDHVHTPMTSTIRSSWGGFVAFQWQPKHLVANLSSASMAKHRT